MKKYNCALTIAGSDCSGGAGIQADLKTFATLKCYGASVITALTAQNTQGVQAINPITAAFVSAQINSVLQDITVSAVKIGMLHNAAIITTVANRLQHYQIKPIILDPVMVAKGGKPLLQTTAIASLKKNLLPLCQLLTPNLHEAELFINNKITNRNAMEQAAISIATQGPAAVLIKGGHLPETQSADCLYIKADNSLHWFETERINTLHTHGTGCTLSAAITAFLAREYALIAAIKLAKEYLTAAIKSGSQYQLGSGCGPVNHGYLHE